MAKGPAYSVLLVNLVRVGSNQVPRTANLRRERTRLLDQFLKSFSVIEFIVHAMDRDQVLSKALCAPV